jgi:hypothetical protein
MIRLRKAVVAMVAACSVLAVPGASDAGPEADGPVGAKCTLTAAANARAQAHAWIGLLGGGPLLVVSGSATATASGTLTCTVQVGSNSVHASADAPGGKVSASGTGAVVLPHSVVSFTATVDQAVYVCSHFTYTGGATVYWHADNDDDPSTDTGHWSSDINSECALSIAMGGVLHVV